MWQSVINEQRLQIQHDVQEEICWEDRQCCPRDPGKVAGIIGVLSELDID